MEHLMAAVKVAHAKERIIPQEGPHGGMTHEQQRIAISLLEDVMRCHRDAESCDYNECEKDPCHWCEQAAIAIALN